MILLLSSSSDVNIDYVISWLLYYNHDYLRINADEILNEDVKFSIEEKLLFYKGCLIDISNINAVWYRKFGGFARTSYFSAAKRYVSKDDLVQLSSEYYSVLSGIGSLFKNKKWLTSPWNSNLNKIDILLMAKEVGFDIPKSFIISHKSELNEGKLISKSVYETYYIKNDNGFYTMFTDRINKGNTKYLPTSFFPSFIQKEISKAYELRIFYINGEFYSMAIFSQTNKQTELDFRKYDWVNPNRRVPYNLPKEIKDKIRLLCKKIGLNCCSIDMIVSKEDGKYYFLEINTTGEFGMVAQPCDYELYKKIAKTLIKMDKNEIRTNNFEKK